MFCSTYEKNLVITTIAMYGMKQINYIEFLFFLIDRNPVSCDDYFRRDNLFAAATVGATVTVTIDPNGPVTAPGETTVTCLKESSTSVCSQVTTLFKHENSNDPFKVLLPSNE